jgi:hypothetical protein
LVSDQSAFNKKNNFSMEYLKKITDLEVGKQKLGIGGAVATGFLGLIYLRRSVLIPIKM